MFEIEFINQDHYCRVQRITTQNFHEAKFPKSMYFVFYLKVVFLLGLQRTATKFRNMLWGGWPNTYSFVKCYEVDCPNYICLQISMGQIA